jgi:tetratricopeptide (TPR) repeat protein
MAATEFGNQKLVSALLQLHKLGKSGILRMERGTARKQLVLSGGKVAFAESNIPEDHLARVLVRMSYLNRQDITKVTVLMKSGQPSDEAIAAATDLSRRQIEEGARELAVSILASMLTWMGSDPKLYAREGLPVRSLDLQIPIPELVAGAARRAAADPATARALPEVQGLVSAGCEALLGVLPLESAELYAHAQAQTTHTVEDLSRLLPADPVKPRELIHRLLLMGVLKLEGALEASQSAGAAKLALMQLEEQLEDLLARFEVANHYEILSVPVDAREEQIHAAYHDMARRYHPDRFEARNYGAALRARAERLFTYITGAHTILSNPAARASYDEMRKVQDSRVESALQSRATTDVETDKMAEALFRAGCAALAAKDYEKSVRHLKECVWLRPDTARYQHFLGVAQAGTSGFLKEAEQHLLKALEIDPLRVETHLELARLYLKVNLPKRAEAKLYEVLRWDPGNRTASRLLVEIRGEEAGG